MDIGQLDWGNLSISLLKEAERKYTLSRALTCHAKSSLSRKFPDDQGIIHCESCKLESTRLGGGEKGVLSYRKVSNVKFAPSI